MGKNKRLYKIADNSAKKIDSAKERAEITADFGLCNTCHHLTFIEYELSGNMGLCMSIYFNGEPMRLTPCKRINKCDHFHPKGQMSLREMKEIALILDLKPQIGFQITEPDYKEIYEVNLGQEDIIADD